MHGTNGTSENPPVGARFRSLFERIVKKPAEPTAVGKAITKASELIKAHPFAAVGIAVGAGYAIVRIARR